MCVCEKRWTKTTFFKQNWQNLILEMNYVCAIHFWNTMHTFLSFLSCPLWNLFLLMYVASFTVVNFFLCYCMMALLRSEKLMEIMSTQEASAKPSKILSKLFPSFRIRRENGQSSKSKNGRQIWTKPGKNTTHSSWNDEEQHPELVKRIACVVISLPPPSFYFHSMYEKKIKGQFDLCF